jgi:hypothetical protein
LTRGALFVAEETDDANDNDKRNKKIANVYPVENSGKKQKRD